MTQRSFKVFDQALTTLHPSIRPFNHPPSRHWNKSHFPLSCFLGCRGLGCQFKANLRHNLGIDLLQGLNNLSWVISVVKQNGNLWEIDRLSTKVVFVAAQHFNQPLVIRDIRFRAMGKKRQSQSIDGKMSLNTVGALVMTKPFGFNTGITGVFHRLRVDDE